jgi:fimbrial chaperone protein
MRKSYQKIAVWIFSCLLSVVVFADNLGITPTQVYLSPKNAIGILRVTNNNSHAVVLQISLKKWFQKLSSTTFKDTQDLLVTPPIFTLPPGKTQIIRVAMVTPPDRHTEKAYRLFLREVIPEVKTPVLQRADQLNIALRISLPVIIAPVEPAQQHLQWRIVEKKKHLLLTAVNDGSKVVFINQLQVFNKEKQPITALLSTFAYILPHEQFNWSIDRNNQGMANKVGAMINREYAIADIS